MSLSLSRLGKIVSETVFFGEKGHGEYTDLVDKSISIANEDHNMKPIVSCSYLGKQDYINIVITIAKKNGGTQAIVWRHKRKSKKYKLLGDASMFDLSKADGVVEYGRKIGMLTGKKRESVSSKDMITDMFLFGDGCGDEYDYILDNIEEYSSLKKDDIKTHNTLKADINDDEIGICFRIFTNDNRSVSLLFKISKSKELEFVLEHEFNVIEY